MNFKTGDVISIYDTLYQIDGTTKGGSVRLKQWLENDGEIHGMELVRETYLEKIHKQEQEQQKIEYDERCRDSHIFWEYTLKRKNEKICAI